MATNTQTTAAVHRRLPKWTTSFGWQVIIGLALGIVAGFAAVAIGAGEDGVENGLTQTLDIIGADYVTLLKAAVIPLVVTAIISSIANLRQVSNAARLAWNTLLWFGITALIAVSIGIGLGITIRPGEHAGHGLEAGAPPVVGSWLGFLQGIIPANFLGLGVSAHGTGADTVFGVNFNVLQVIVISAAIGIAALKVGKKADLFLSFNESLLSIIQKALWWIIRLAPIGTFGLIGHAIATYGTSTITSLLWLIAAVYAGLFLVLFVVYPILIRSHGLSVKQYYTGAWPAIELGFVSRSSIGTLPLTQRIAERNLGVPRAYASFAVPLGATTKMDGCAAVYPAVASIFVAQFYGLHLTPIQYGLIILVSVVGSAATAGTTGAVVMLTLTLSTVGLPLSGVGLLLAIDPVLDMGRTAINVAGQALVPTIVAKRAGILDHSLYNAKREGVPFSDDLAELVSSENDGADAEKELQSAN